MRIATAIHNDSPEQSPRTRADHRALWRTARMLPPLVGIAALLLASAASGQNIVIVVIDDAGIERFGTYNVPGSDPPDTQTIDSIAQAGVRFDNFWAYSACSQFRASLLTGVGPWVHGVGSVISNSTDPDHDPQRVIGLEPGRMNIAHMVKGATPSYRTEAIGKWHVAGSDPEHLPEAPEHPINSGFDRFDGSLSNPRQAFAGTQGLTGYSAWERCHGDSTAGVTCELNQEYSTRFFTERAVECITRDVGNPGAPPFLCYVAYHAAHVPFHDPPDSLYPPLGDGTCNSSGDPDADCHKEILEALDWDLATLDAAIDYDNTTLFIVADNGTPNQAADGPYPSGHNKGTVYQGGLHTPLIVKGEQVGQTQVNTAVAAIVQATDIFATVAEIAGVDPSVVPPGSQSLIPHLTQDVVDPPLHEIVMSETFKPNGLDEFGIPSPNTANWLRAVRDSRYKLTWRFINRVFSSQFFDLQGADQYTELNDLSIGFDEEFILLNTNRVEDFESQAYVELRADLGELDTDCLCKVQDITPSAITPPLKKVASGGKGSSGTRKITMIVESVDAPGALCDAGEESEPAAIHLEMVDDDGDLLVDSAKIRSCKGPAGTTSAIDRIVFFRGPLNCANSEVPGQGGVESVITAMGSAFGTLDYVKDLTITCNP